jgi:hypothetical protein
LAPPLPAAPAAASGSGAVPDLHRVVDEWDAVMEALKAQGRGMLAALLSRFRERGEGATFGTAGSGTTSHLAPALLLHLAGLKGTLVPYRGSGPAMNDLAAGVVDAVMDQTVTMIPAHRGGTAVALAVSGTQRAPQIPDVPTFAEAGLPQFDLIVWNAIAAPRATPHHSWAGVPRVARASPSASRRTWARARMARWSGGVSLLNHAPDSMLCCSSSVRTGVFMACPGCDRRATMAAALFLGLRSLRGPSWKTTPCPPLPCTCPR